MFLDIVGSLQHQSLKLSILTTFPPMSSRVNSNNSGMIKQLFCSFINGLQNWQKSFSICSRTQIVKHVKKKIIFPKHSWIHLVHYFWFNYDLGLFGSQKQPRILDLTRVVLMNLFVNFHKNLMNHNLVCGHPTDASKDFKFYLVEHVFQM